MKSRHWCRQLPFDPVAARGRTPNGIIPERSEVARENHADSRFPRCVFHIRCRNRRSSTTDCGLRLKRSYLFASRKIRQGPYPVSAVDSRAPADAADFLTKEFGLQAPYARRGIDYYTQKKVYPINGDVTLSGLKVNIEVQAQDGIIKGAFPPPAKYADTSYLRQAQKELGLQ